MVCSILKLNNPIPPNALCIVRHSLFTFRFTPRNNRSRKFCFFNTSVAVDRGVDSTARPYLTPAYNLKRYAIQPSFAGRWPFLILLIHFSTQSFTLCCTCASFCRLCLTRFPVLSLLWKLFLVISLQCRRWVKGFQRPGWVAQHMSICLPSNSNPQVSICIYLDSRLPLCHLGPLSMPLLTFLVLCVLQRLWLGWGE